MVFKSDKQRKAVMARLKNQPRSDISPRVVEQRNGISGAVRRFRASQAIRTRERREARIRRELEAQKVEARQARQLEAELALEKSRERIIISALPSLSKSEINGSFLASSTVIVDD